jgi:hypothetical protein
LCTEIKLISKSGYLIPAGTKMTEKLKLLFNNLRFITFELMFQLSVILAAGLIPAIPPQISTYILPALLMGSAISLSLASGFLLIDLLFLPVIILCGILAAPFKIWGLLLFASVLHLREYENSGLLLVQTFFLSIYSLLINVPQFFFIPDSLAAIQSSILAMISGLDVEIGDSVSAIHILVFFLLGSVSQSIRYKPKQALLSALLYVSAFFILQGILISIFKTPPARIDMWLSLLCFVPLFIIERILSLNYKPVQTAAIAIKSYHLGLPLLALFILLSSISGPEPGALDGKRIAFRKDGEWSWEMGRYGKRQGPRMGGFLEVLSLWGASVEIVEDEALLNPGEFDLIFLVHPDKVVNAELTSSLYNYMEEGGAVVVVGEHTNVHDIEIGVNSFLQKTGIRLKDDSAIPAFHGWNWNYNQKYYLNPVTRGMDNSNDLNVSIGGSLDVKYPAYPLISGVMSFSDTGNPNNPRGKMGDNRYRYNERFGSISLLASQAVGSGILTVIGDTSALMSLSSIQVWPFYLNLVNGLCGYSPLLSGRVWLSVWLVLLLLGGLLVYTRARVERTFVMSGLLVLIALYGTEICSAHFPKAVNPEKICWIDYSHQPNWLSNGKLDWSVMSLAETVMNSDLMSLFLWELDADILKDSKFYLISGTAKEYLKDEIDLLLDYVESGGHLLISCDYRRSSPLKNLLAAFDLEVLDVPLGTAPEAIDYQGNELPFEFYEAWPIATIENPKTVTELDTLISCWDYPIVISKNIGQGKITVAGEEHIFARYFLEGKSQNGKPLNTAYRFVSEQGQRKTAPRRDSPKKTKYIQHFRNDLNYVSKPRPNVPLDIPQLRQQQIFNILELNPSHPPGDPPVNKTAVKNSFGKPNAAQRAASTKSGAKKLTPQKKLNDQGAR